MNGPLQWGCSNDVAGEIVEDCGQVIPAPAYDLEIGEVCLPHLVRGGRLVSELIGRLDHDEGGASDEIMGFQQTIN